MDYFTLCACDVCCAVGRVVIDVINFSCARSLMRKMRALQNADVEAVEAASDPLDPLRLPSPPPNSSAAASAAVMAASSSSSGIRYDGWCFPMYLRRAGDV